MGNHDPVSVSKNHEANNQQDDGIAIDLSSAVQNEQIRILYRQATTTLILGYFAALIGTAALWTVADRNTLITWIIILSIVTAARLILFIVFKNRTTQTQDLGLWAKLYVIGAVFAGFAWGWIVLLFDPAWSTPYQIILIVLLAGIIAGSAPANSAFFPALPAFVIPLISLFLVVLLIQREIGYNILAALTVVYGAQILISGRKFNRNLFNSLRLSHTNKSLSKVLDKNNAELRRHRDHLQELVAEQTSDLIIAKEMAEKANLVVKKSPVVLFQWIPTDGWPVEFVSSNVTQFGYKDDELLSGDILYSSIIHPDDLERVRKEVQEYSNSGVQAFTQEYRILSPAGELFWIDDRTTIKRDADGNITQYQGVVMDITERQQAQEEKERLLRELQNVMKMKAIGQLTGGIAHNFNNILSIILGFSEMALHRCKIAGQTKAVDYLTSVHRAGERASDLVSQMLVFSSSKEGEYQPMHLAPLIKDDIKMLHSTLPASIDIKTKLEDNLPIVLIDPVQLTQALIHLSINACDAMCEKGTLSIHLSMANEDGKECSICHTQLDGNWVVISVSDTGNGIEPKNIENIFNPFYTTKDASEGTGLGLSMIFGIMRRHKGHVLVESEPGKGSILRLLFPPIDEKASQTHNSEDSLNK